MDKSKDIDNSTNSMNTFRKKNQVKGLDFFIIIGILIYCRCAYIFRNDLKLILIGSYRGLVCLLHMRYEK